MTKAIHCETCCYWSPARVTEVEDQVPRIGPRPDRPPLRTGQCRRFPPVTAQTIKGPRSQWPITIASHWCGEHGEIVANRTIAAEEAAE